MLKIITTGKMDQLIIKSPEDSRKRRRSGYTTSTLLAQSLCLEIECAPNDRMSIIFF